ncbi:MAG: transketolase [bacterium]|nr:transketolase [bacterium]
MKEKDKEIIEQTANTIRGLSIDAIESANSGHPGLPLGCAEIASYLYGFVLNYNTKDSWINRDRFILSAGHGSMLLYSILHLAGYPVTINDIKTFRKMGSLAAGHPEYRSIKGIETTSGPLGQGLANAVGIALGNKLMSAEFEVDELGLLDAHVYTLAGDGCLMEGISYEACSLAGHLKLDNLIVIYDANNICLDGSIDECFSENVSLRFKAFGWNVVDIDGYDLENLSLALNDARKQDEKPSLIIARTVIGKGSPVADTSESHGKALGRENAEKTKQNLGIPLEPLFYVPQEVREFFEIRLDEVQKAQEEWQLKFDKWAEKYPEKAVRWKNLIEKNIPEHVFNGIKEIDMPGDIASRQSSGIVINYLAEKLPGLVGGSADLSGSDNTMIKKADIITGNNFKGKNIKYGVREFAMAAVSSGLSLQGMVLPFCGTFLVFSDYMRNAIRVASLMKLKVIYQFTHDSIFLGEDGPTHQPVEHLASLRAVPGLTVIRPADNNEVKGAWSTALKLKTPVALILSRQKLKSLSDTSFESVEYGGYVVKKACRPEDVDYCLLATGSELALALDVALKLEDQGNSVRLVSMPSFELFDAQDMDYKESVLGGNIKKYCSIEAQSSLGWHKYTGRDGISISVDSFGLSAPASDLADHFGFTVDKIIEKL